MKAVILAGGQGTRLKAISAGLPKPMMPILGKPMLEHIVALLKQCGFEELCMTLHYQPRSIMEYFGGGGQFGVSIQYRIEEHPFGTAGSVKQCMDFIGGEDFLVIAGDCACDFALDEAYAQHDGGVSILLAREEEPLQYGLVVTDESGRVAGFLEKPGWEKVVTDAVSTGIYIISPGVMDYVPAGQSFDFAGDLFPRLMEKGVPLRGITLDGYWKDIGTPRSYYQANLDALDGLYRLPGGIDAPRSVIPCRSRAALMGRLARAACEFAADWSDGLRFQDGSGSVHAAPLADQSAIIIEGDGPSRRQWEALARKWAGEQ